MARALAFALLLVAGCRDEKMFHAARILGGVSIPAETLNTGHALYVTHCESCHGKTGAGDGPRARGMDPRPRDLRAGQFEFTSVGPGEMATDADLVRVIRHGLIGTAMTATNISDDDAQAIGHFIKTMSPRWTQSPVGHPFRPRPELATPQKRLAAHSYEEWVSLGERVYHVEGACWMCHPAYETKKFIRENSPKRVPSFPDSLYEARDSPSAFGPLTATDFLTDLPRGGTSEAAIYRAIAAGLGGTRMEGARDTLPDEYIWALVYYVRSLLDERDQGKAGEHRARLQAQTDP